MKKAIFIILALAFITGCGQSAVRSEYWDHDTMYKSWDHMIYSWYGYRHPTAADNQKSVEQGWWGIEVPYVPGQ
ncbi:MAG: hypothetical protein M0036_22950 [Desulfobacteraceae bacterium]|nr:hypothetical protein [Desulfobacteraceae bacterium]